ncbi:14490_t:CDS:1, partial [Racocetra fulgida]
TIEENSSAILDFKKKGGRPRFEHIWKNFIKILKPNKKHPGAKCNYCSKKWERGKPAQMEIHLARLCTK